MTEDNELIEHIARAMAPGAFEHFQREKHGSVVNHAQSRQRWLRLAGIALTAYRNHEVEL